MLTPIPCALMEGRIWKSLYFLAFDLPRAPALLGCGGSARAATA